MNLELDFRSGIPIYLQVVDRIKEMIANGRLKPGGQLPTVRALATELRINFNTVARAYRILDEAGVISTQQGRGTYILEDPPPGMSESVRQTAFITLTDRYLADALRLGFSPDEILAAFHRQIQSKQEGVEE
jgi:DNA-binding transcriptional regulator YhcF (GntR family)